MDLVLMGRDVLSKSLIQFSVDGWGCVPSIIYLRPNYGGGNEDNEDLLQKVSQTERKPQSQKTNQSDHMDHSLD